MQKTWTRVIATGFVLISVLTGCGKGTNPAPAQVGGPSPAVQPAKAPATPAPGATPEGATITQLILAKKNDEAVQMADKAAKERPKDAEAQFLVGLSRFARGDLDGAIQAYLKTLELNKNHFVAMNNLGNAFRDTKNFAVAEDWYRKAMTANPQFAVPVQQMALMLESRGKVDEAIRVLEDGARRIPTNADLQFSLGLMYEEKSLKDQAKAAYAKALQISPNLADAKQRLTALGN